MLSKKNLDISEFTILEEEIKKENKWNETLRLFFLNRGAFCGLLIVISFILIGIFGPFIFPVDPFEIVAFPLSPPSLNTFGGTDYFRPRRLYRNYLWYKTNFIYSSDGNFSYNCDWNNNWLYFWLLRRIY